MEWDNLSRELRVLHTEILEALGFNPLWIGLPFVVLALIVGVIKIANMLRSWANRPYASPSKLLAQLAKAQGLSKRDVRILRGANPGANCLMHAQMLLDPAAWPTERKSLRESTLFDLLFKDQLDSPAVAEDKV